MLLQNRYLHNILIIVRNQKIQIFLSITALFFAGLFFFQNRNTIVHLLHTASKELLFFSFLWMALAGVCYAGIVFFLARYYQFNASYFKIFYITSFTNVARYLPGGVWDHLTLATHLDKTRVKGSSIKRLLVTNIEIAVFSGILFSLSVAMLLTMYPAIMAISIIFICLFLAWRHSFVKNKNSLYILYAYVVAVLQWLCFGFSTAYLIAAVDSSFSFSPYSFLGTSLAYTTSWIVGFLFFIAPSGAGAREVVFNSINHFFHITVISGITISLFSRLVMLFRDMLFVIFSYSTSIFLEKKAKQKS